MANIQSAIAKNVKPNEVKNFEQQYYSASDKDRLKIYSDFRNTCSSHYAIILQNPFIDIHYHDWYDKLGYDELARLNFDVQKVEPLSPR